MTPEDIQNAIYALDRQILIARNCANWLADNGIKVVSVRIELDNRDPTVTVSPSPQVSRALKLIAKQIGRRKYGSLITMTWVAESNGCRIQWEESAYDGWE